MTKKGLKVVLGSEVTDKNMRKLEHYYGIEFKRGESDSGSVNGYHAMIGDASLLREMRFHNQMKIAAVKNAEIQSVLNQTNWKKTADGGNAVIDGSDNADIMQVHTKGVWAILGGTHPTYERYIVSDSPFSYDEDEAVYYGMSGETPDYAVLLNGKMRSIRNEGVNGSHAAGNGTNHSDNGYGTAAGNGYPSTQLSRFQGEQYARAKNEGISDANSNLPYTNICNIDYELAFAFLAIECRTKILHSVFGHAISGNAAPMGNGNDWGRVTGLRLTADNGATYTYATFGTSVFLNGNQQTNLWNALNGSYPILKMFEAQLAVSNGDNLESVRDADGNTLQTIADGVMTGIWTKRFSFQLNCALTNGGESKIYTVEVVLRVPVWRGRSRLWGHLLTWTSGYELLQYLGEDNKTHHKAYRCPSVELLTTDSDASDKNEEGMFPFESTYDLLGEVPAITATSVQWAQETYNDNGVQTMMPKVPGGARDTFDGAGVYLAADAAEGVYRRRGADCGGSAISGFASFRYAFCNNSPAGSLTYRGFGFRVTLA